MMSGLPWEKESSSFSAAIHADEAVKTRLDYAKRYARLGWAVIPCYHIENKACSCGKECSSPGKHPLLSHGLKQATLDIEKITDYWTRWPNANIGVATGKVSGFFAVDVDVKHDIGKFGDESLAQLEKDNSRFPDTVMAITGSGGNHYLFNYPNDIEIPNSASRIAPDIDIRGDNGYIIVEPSTHIAGLNYAWEASSDPIFSHQVADAPAWLVERVKKKHNTKVNKNGFVCDSSEWSVLSDEQKAEHIEALSFCNNVSRDDWLAIGMAIHAMDAGNTGFKLWDDWSQSCDKYDAKDQARVWVSFSNNKETKLNRESIFYYARKNGYQSKAEKTSQKQVSQLIDSINSQVVSEPSVCVKAIDYLFPVSNLNRIAGLINAGSSVYSDTATTQAVIALASTVTARRYVTPQRESCQLYTGICSGSIGSIGELRYAAKGARDVLSQSGLRRMVREHRISSSLALYKFLWSSPAALYLCDDYSAMLKLVQRQTTGGMEIVLNNLTRLYDENIVQLDSQEDAGLRHHDDDQPILVRPGLSMLALLHYSQLAIFAKTSELGRGAVEQFLFAICDNDEVKFKESSPVHLPADLIDVIRRIRGVPPVDNASGDLALDAIFDQLPGIESTLITVQFAESIAPYDAMIDEVTEDRRYRMFKSGARKNMRRLMTILAAWNDPIHPVADKSIMEWCAQYVSGQLSRLLEIMEVVASDEGKADVGQKVLDAIIKQGADGIRASDLHSYCRAYKSLSKEKRQELLDKLLDDGDIEMATIKTKSGQTKKRLVYKKFLINPAISSKV